MTQPPSESHDLTHLSWELDRDGVATLLLDRKGSSVNTLAPDVLSDFEEVLSRCESDDAVVGVVIASAKPDSFVVGGDLAFLAALEDDPDPAGTLEQGQEMFARLKRLSRRKPIVAAIHGPCLGGGLELAMACSGRIASNDEALTQLGQPEVRLGLMPGAGGTQRLPELIGLTTALDMILTGRTIRPRRARAIGLVNEICPRELLLTTARQRALSPSPVPPRRVVASLRTWTAPRNLQHLALEANPAGRRLVFKKAQERMLSETKGLYPAPPAALQAVRTGIEQGPEAGYAEEVRQFVRLLSTPESHALRSIFNATQELKKESPVANGAGSRRINRVGVIGGGLMGAGIATVNTTEASVMTRIKEIDHERAGQALAHVRREVTRQGKRRKQRKGATEAALRNVTTTTHYDRLGDPELVIEAVFEDLGLKQQILREVEEASGDETVFATNTSSIPIAAIAEHAKRPEQVVGMHYFSPVEKMPLLEVITTEATADWVIATAVEFGKRQGKTVIVVNDGPGFYTTRVLAPYAAEFVAMVAEGIPIDRIEAAATGFGFPIGPAALSDEVGIDVQAKIVPVLAPLLDDRAPSPAMIERLVAAGRLGKKSGMGFYRYRDGKRTEIDADIYAVLDIMPDNPTPTSEIQDRLVLSVVNEAVRCLQEGILRSARDGDVGAIMGLGWPPYTGGPFWLVDQRGAASVVDRMEELAPAHGSRFEPAPLLREHAASGSAFRT